MPNSRLGCPGGNRFLPPDLTAPGRASTTGEATALIGGRIRSGRREAEALLIEDGRVSVVGSREEVLRARPTGAVTRDLVGRTAIPGLIDPHVHVLGLVLGRVGADLSGAATLADLLERLRPGLSTPGDGPLLGRGWDQERFPGGRYPTAADLDPLTRDRPVILYRHCHHAAVVNSAGLTALGIDRRSPDPPGGRIGRTADGTPNGLLFDNALAPLWALAVPAVAREDGTLGRILTEATGLGLTAIGAMSCGPEDLDALDRQGRSGTTMPRVRAYLRWEHLPRLGQYRGWGDGDRRRLAGVKVVADGSFGARTAWLSEPYADAPGETGLSLADDDALDEVLETTRRAALTPAVHAIGDRALTSVLRALGRVPQPRRPRVEHAALTPPSLVEELKRIDPIVVVQPRFAESDTWLAARLGPERARWTYAFRTLRDRGITLAGSSDAPIEPLDPWTGMRAAVGAPVREERLAEDEAMELYTVPAAEALGLDGGGVLLPGAPADLVILSTSDVPAAIRLGSEAVDETWIGGRPVYARPAGPSALSR